MNTTLDAYTIRARLWPFLIVALPLGFATLALLPGGIQGWDVLWSLFVFSGGTALFAEIGRNFGKVKEPRLFQVWGGKPTTRMLRHRGALNKQTLTRRHNQLRQMIEGLKIPTLDDENANPLEADEVYDSCIEFLRVQTRDKKKFPLVFEENCNYGFRRNLWGMRPLGILVSSLGIVTIGVFIALSYLVKGIPPSPLVIVGGLANLLFLLGWITLFTPKWVKVAAEAYAQHLLESCDSICNQGESFQ